MIAVVSFGHAPDLLAENAGRSRTERENLTGIRSRPFGTPDTVSRGLGSTKNQGAKALDKIGCETIMLDKETHVDRPVQRIENQVEVRVLVEFTARHRPA